MSKYLRAKTPGGLYFFTLITFDRGKFLTSNLARRILREVWKDVQNKHPFTVEAVCLLPEHLHCIWRLPEGDSDYPQRWRLIKGMFSRRYLKAGGKEGARNQSHLRKREAAIWQRRYWEHRIRDDEDFEKHFDYIHFNPVKHALVHRPQDWMWTSFHRYQRLGYYPHGWGCVGLDFPVEQTFGESVGQKN